MPTTPHGLVGQSQYRDILALHEKGVFAEKNAWIQ